MPLGVKGTSRWRVWKWQASKTALARPKTKSTSPSMWQRWKYCRSKAVERGCLDEEGVLVGEEADVVEVRAVAGGVGGHRLGAGDLRVVGAQPVVGEGEVADGEAGRGGREGGGARRAVGAGPSGFGVPAALSKTMTAARGSRTAPRMVNSAFVGGHVDDFTVGAGVHDDRPVRGRRPRPRRPGRSRRGGRAGRGGPVPARAGALAAATVRPPAGPRGGCVGAASQHSPRQGSQSPRQARTGADRPAPR